MKNLVVVPVSFVSEHIETLVRTANQFLTSQFYETDSLKVSSLNGTPSLFLKLTQHRAYGLHILFLVSPMLVAIGGDRHGVPRAS